MGNSHRVAGVVAWLAAAPVLDVHGWEYAAGVMVAAATSHGRLSPDADRYPLLGKIIPGGHRGITHWWPIPVIMYFVATRLTTVRSHWEWLPGPVPVSWAIYALAVAWASHIMADFMFGKIPLLPRWRHGWQYAGLGFKTGGLVEKAIAVPALIITGGWLLLSL